MKKLLCSLLFLFITHTSMAAEIADVHFDDSITLPNANETLVLNGLGIRYKFFFKIYIAALYVKNKSTSAEEVVSAANARRMTMYFLYDEVAREKLVAGWNEGFENNLSSKQFNALKPRIEKFNAMFETMKQGEVIHLDYIPGSGTVVIIRGQQKGIVSGEDFNRALLNIWLGDYPVGEELKQSLLGSIE